MTSTTTKRYFSANELAERFGVHVITVWKWASSGRLPKPVKLLGSRATRWRVEDIERTEATAHTREARRG